MLPHRLSHAWGRRRIVSHKKVRKVYDFNTWRAGGAAFMIIDTQASFCDITSRLKTDTYVESYRGTASQAECKPELADDLKEEADLIGCAGWMRWLDALEKSLV
jgi:folate-dependent phosphoribosylglycinamide formyltransferase PurN